MENAVYLSDSSKTVISSIFHVSILSHQPPHNSLCCSSPVSLILHHDPITFQDVREEDGCTWELHPPTHSNPSQLIPARCRISISCHERKSPMGSEFMWGNYENISSRRKNDAKLHITEFSSFTSEKKCLHLCTCEPLKPQHRHTNLPFIFSRWHRAYDPLPPNPCHPKHNAIFERNWVNQWNQDELIILTNLLSVIF